MNLRRPRGFPGMARIAHLSDVHFGMPVAVVAGAEAWLAEHRPDLVVISGDFTQRARVEQYREAGAFLDRLEGAGLKTLGVPGNHDVPLYDVVRRFARPLARYRRYIDDDLPWFESDRLAVLGINTARSLTIKDGRISRAQMELIRSRFADVPDDRTRVLVTHHPCSRCRSRKEWQGGRPPRGCDRGGLRGRRPHPTRRPFPPQLFGLGAQMVKKAGPALVIQAGTATSTRLRAGERRASTSSMRAATTRSTCRWWNGTAPPSTAPPATPASPSTARNGIRRR